MHLTRKCGSKSIRASWEDDVAVTYYSLGFQLYRCTFMINLHALRNADDPVTEDDGGCYSIAHGASWERTFRIVPMQFQTAHV